MKHFKLRCFFGEMKKQMAGLKPQRWEKPKARGF